MNIDRTAMNCISMDLTQQALQTNGRLFLNFVIIFRISYFFSHNSGVGFMQARWGGSPGKGTSGDAWSNGDAPVEKKLPHSNWENQCFVTMSQKKL